MFAYKLVKPLRYFSINHILTGNLNSQLAEKTIINHDLDRF